MNAAYVIRRVQHVAGLNAWVVLDGDGLQAWPKPGTEETYAACQRYIERRKAAGLS